MRKSRASIEKERQLIKKFWMTLSFDQQATLCEVDKNFVLKSLRSHHRHTCSCPTCGKRRTIFDREVQLFEDYCNELEHTKNIPIPPDKQHPLKEMLNSPPDPAPDTEPSSQYPFGCYLSIMDGKIRLRHEYLKDSGKQFAELM